MQMAQARGAKVWSTPWTPAAGFKSVDDIYDTDTATGGGLNGGSYLGSGNNATNQAYASQLANYVANMQSQGINLYAISIQNEPDADVTNYEACQWSGAQIHDFVTNLYNALVAEGVGSTKIMLPESENWTDPQNLAGPAMSDPAVAAEVGIVADHDYVPDNSVGDQTVPAQIVTPSGQATWETEVSLLSGSDSSIANGLYWGQRIYLFLTQAQANAYHYWWLVAYETGNEGLLDNNGSITKRLFVFGKYSRFVRPGYYRIDAANAGDVLISAFDDTNSDNFVMVAVNTNAAAISQSFNLTNFPGVVSSVTPWITSATNSLANLVPVSVSGSSFTYLLPAQSVVTFVGQSVTIPSPNIIPSGTAYLPSASAFVLTWNATAGATYSVLKTNVLSGSSANWPAIVTGYPAGGAVGGPLSYTDTTATASTAYYRVRSP
jgi:glucuronoarabinoxylan endo-1,4-beta-xylanase